MTASDTRMLSARRRRSRGSNISRSAERRAGIIGQPGLVDQPSDRQRIRCTAPERSPAAPSLLEPRQSALVRRPLLMDRLLELASVALAELAGVFLACRRHVGLRCAGRKMVDGRFVSNVLANLRDFRSLLHEEPPFGGQRLSSDRYSWPACLALTITRRSPGMAAHAKLPETDRKTGRTVCRSPPDTFSSSAWMSRRKKRRCSTRSMTASTSRT